MKDSLKKYDGCVTCKSGKLFALYGVCECYDDEMLIEDSCGTILL